jgi:hypothetical protein
MSTHQEKPNEPVLDVTVVTDGEDEDVVDLEAVASLAKAKLEEDLAKAKARNDRIARKKQERADRLAAEKLKADREAAEAQRKRDEAAKAKKKVPVETPVRSFYVFKKSETDLLSRLNRWFRLRARRRGRPNER